MRAFVFSLLFTFIVATGCSTHKVCDARGESQICELHHDVMRSVEVKNPHLKEPPSQRYLEARVRFFVHSKPNLFGLPDECKSCMVFICDDCERAEQQWNSVQR